MWRLEPIAFTVFRDMAELRAVPSQADLQMLRAEALERVAKSYRVNAVDLEIEGDTELAPSLAASAKEREAQAARLRGQSPAYRHRPSLRSV